MNSYDELIDILKAQIELATGIKCYWQEGEAGYANSLFKIHITSEISPIGLDEHRTAFEEDASPGQEFTEIVCGPRSIKVTISYQHLDHDLTKKAIAILSKLKAQLQFRSARDALSAQNFAIASLGSIVSGTLSIDNRTRSYAVLELDINASIWYADPTKYGYIAAVEVQGNL